MVDDLAPGAYATGARAGVYTLQIRTCSISRTVRVSCALRATSGVRVSEIALDAGAAGSGVSVLALGVSCTRTWVARVHRARVYRLDNFRDLVTLSEGITVETLGALADGQVVPDGAPCIQSARPNTGVDTVLLGAGLGPPALVVDDTLWSTARRGTNITTCTGAHRSDTKRLAGRVRPAGGGVAGVSRLRRRDCYSWCLMALLERVAFVVDRASADGMMSDDTASGVDSAPARTRVHTPLVEAGPVLRAV